MKARLKAALATLVRKTHRSDQQNMKERIREAVEQARANYLAHQTENVRNRDEKIRQLEQDADKRAALIIANIPETIRQSTAFSNKYPGERVFEARIMTLDDLESEPKASQNWRYRYIDGPQIKLLFAAQKVFDFCREAGLQPCLVYDIPDGFSDVDGHFFIRIMWTVPVQH